MNRAGLAQVIVAVAVLAAVGWRFGLSPLLPALGYLTVAGLARWPSSTPGPGGCRTP